MPITVHPQPDKVGQIRSGTSTTAAEMLGCASYSDKHRRILRSSYPIDPSPDSAPRPQAIAAYNDAQTDNFRPRVTRPGQPRQPTPARAKRISHREVREAQLAAAAAAASATNPPASPGDSTATPRSVPNPQQKEGIVPFPNGFVHTVLRAWEQDLHLTLRPDDVWLAILTQFSFFVNARAEELRHFFVTHQGKKQVTVVVDDPLDKLDVPALAQALVRVLQAQMVDEGMVEWMMPGFSTTTEDDKAVAAVAVLGTMRQYFHYGAIQGCGFPSVTLQGERSDWEDLQRRVARLAQFGDEAAEWARCLGKVVEGMVASFDRPDAEQVKEFWMKASHSAGADGSGEPRTLSGWLTAFCWWTAEGKKQRMYDDEELSDWWCLGQQAAWVRLELDGVVFPVINREIPAAVTRAPMTWVDSGSGADLATVLLAGLTGMKLMDDTGSKVRPASGWWILKGDPVTGGR